MFRRGWIVPIFTANSELRKGEDAEYSIFFFFSFFYSSISATMCPFASYGYTSCSDIVAGTK